MKFDENGIRIESLVTCTDATPSAYDQALGVLVDGFYQYSLEKRNLTRDPDNSYFYVLKDAQEKILGGIVGLTVFGMLTIHLLWVSPELRRKGYGTKLIALAEEFGRSKNCHFSCLETMDQSFQKLYEKLGYQVDCSYPKGQHEFAWVRMSKLFNHWE